MTVGDEPCDQIDQEVDGAAMARMLNLTDVFELIGDGLDDGAFAQEELVGPVEQTVVHLFAQLGDELEPVGDQQLLGQRLGQIAFVAKEFAHRGLATSSTAIKDAMGVNAGIVADGKRSGVDEADASAATQLRVQVGDQRNEDRGHQLHEARIAHQGGKLAAQMTVDILGVVGFECPVVRLLEQDDNGHHFTGIHLAWAYALVLS